MVLVRILATLMGTVNININDFLDSLSSQPHVTGKNFAHKPLQARKVSSHISSLRSFLITLGAWENE
jgi:hypothetical protein